jgi:predicted SnoaL-like aldol condensation-catalyzing enzyme
MSTEQNKAVVRRFVEASLNTMNSNLVDDLFAPDYVNHMLPGGIEGFKQFIAMMRSTYPDLKVEYKIERMMAEGDYVMMRASSRLSYKGKEATGSGLGEYRLVNGKIVEDWPLSGALELLQALGIQMPA